MPAAVTTIADMIALWSRIETWRPVAGWPYEVSSFGNVRRIGKKTCLAWVWANGYAAVNFCQNGVIQQFQVSRLVCQAFYGDPPFPDAYACHNDRDRNNNRVGNLRWAPPADNQRDRVRHGTDLRGSEIGNAKLTEADIPAIRGRLRRETYGAIAADYGVTPSNISAIKRGRSWRHVRDRKARAA